MACFRDTPDTSAKRGRHWHTPTSSTPGCSPFSASTKTSCYGCSSSRTFSVISSPSIAPPSSRTSWPTLLLALVKLAIEQTMKEALTMGNLDEREVVCLPLTPSHTSPRGVLLVGVCRLRCLFQGAVGAGQCTLLQVPFWIPASETATLLPTRLLFVCLVIFSMAFQGCTIP